MLPHLGHVAMSECLYQSVTQGTHQKYEKQYAEIIDNWE